MSPLHRVLAEIRAAPATASLDDLARRLAVSRDELDAMIGYWVHQGELVVEEITGCASSGCASCALAGAGCGGAPGRTGAGLVTVRPAPRA